MHSNIIFFPTHKHATIKIVTTLFTAVILTSQVTGIQEEFYRTICKTVKLSTRHGTRNILTAASECFLLTQNLKLTWFCNFCNGHTLLISHKSKNWKDSKTSNKACATVQAAEHDAVSENIDKKHCSWSPELGFLSHTEPWTSSFSNGH